ncbi:MAG TPA: heparan-alpha-glucosaminide N-acetyltransferase domain-containing protein [Candidatus Didemnitutus sp.]|nr:heparan-alpha-glucosaminide N-acetyltransferase domain-containing protein [Candidatus Didemnitutus sp.]
MTVASSVAAGEIPAPPKRSHRIASIDWMRGFVMLIMIIDHASMAFDRNHLSEDSALYAGSATMALPVAEFLTRWITHICAPTFIFLAGTSLALSVERRVAKGVPAWDIDRNILIRGAIIAAIDPTLISLGVGHLAFGVLFAIGISMMAMAGLRRLSAGLLLAFALGWYAFGEWITGLVWHPPGSPPLWVAFTIGTSGAGQLSVKYPVVPWLAMMMLGWAFGRYLNRFGSGKLSIPPARVMLVAGVASLVIFAVVRDLNGYGNMFLVRGDDSAIRWLQVSKYPPSVSYASLELGLMCVFLWVMMTLEPIIGVRENGLFLVLGQTAMFYYLIHRLVFDSLATYAGLREFGTITATYTIAFGMVVALYPACLWYRKVKAAHPDSFLKYF